MTAIKCNALEIQTSYKRKLTICVFIPPQKDEKNDRLKEPIRKRFIEYLDRAEMLKEFLNNQEKKQKEPVGANGTPKKYKTVSFWFLLQLVY